MTAELEDLAVRVEALTGPDHEVDCTIGALFGLCPHKSLTYERCQGDSGHTCDECGADSWGNRNKAGQGLSDYMPRYTASIDAAMTLVPEGCWAEGSLSSPAALEVHAPMTFDPLGKGWAATPALALCAAALRAIALTQTHKGPHDE